MAKSHPIYVKMPGSIFSPECQALRDNIAAWLEERELTDRDFHSFYSDYNGSGDITKITGAASSNSCRFMCYSFADPKIGVMFKLTFG